MNLEPVTVPQALEYAQRAVLIELSGRLDAQQIMAIQEHLVYSISSLVAVIEQLRLAEEAIVGLMDSNEELRTHLRTFVEAQKPKPAPLPPKRVYDADTDTYFELAQHGYWQVVIPDAPEDVKNVEDRCGITLGDTTVEFRTDSATYDANSGLIHKMLAQAIVEEFGGQREVSEGSKPGVNLPKTAKREPK